MKILFSSKDTAQAIQSQVKHLLNAGLLRIFISEEPGKIIYNYNLFIYQS